MKKTLFFALVFLSVMAFAQDAAPSVSPEAVATTTNEIPTNLIGWLLFIGLKTPILGVFQRILSVLPKNVVTNLLVSLVNVLAANTQEKKVG